MTDNYDHYPFPIAATYRLMAMESQPANGVYRIFDVAEQVCRYLSACMICELSHHGLSDQYDDMFERPTSLGAVHGWIRETLQKSSLPESAGFSIMLKNIYLDGTLLKCLDEVIACRNRTRGHGVTISDRQYREIRTDFMPKIEVVLRALKPITRFTPLIIKGINNFDGEWYEHQVQLAVGDNPYFSVDTIATDSSLTFRKVYLLGPDRYLSSLDPLVVYETCEICDEDQLFLFQSVRNSKAEYLTPIKGCRLERKIDPSTFVVNLGQGTHPSPTMGTGGQSVKLQLSPGLEIGGRYVLQEEIGRGAGGQVFMANDRLSACNVAVKVMKPPALTVGSSPGTNPRVMAERFQREAMAVARIAHPNIVRVLDVGVDRGVHYFVMDLLEGEDLREKLRRGPLDCDEALAIAAQLLQALGVVHEAGIVHRDLKPENIMLHPDGRMKLTDFGVARIKGKETITSDGEIVGTAGYMAPEQVEGKTVDARSDLFAVGAILYEMLTGHRAFKGATFSETMAAILSSSPKPASSCNSTIPPWADNLLASLLEKSPDNRPSSAHAVLTMIDELRQEKSIKGSARIIERVLNKVRAQRPDLAYHYPVEVQRLAIRFGRKKQVLKDFQLRVPRGMRYCVLGRNGSGKTTLIRCVLKIYRPDRGQIHLFGVPFKNRELMNRHIGYIPETPSAFPFLTIRKYLNFLAGIYPRWDRHYILELINRLDLNPEEKIGSLSRGLKTMVSVLAAFGHRPPLLVFDDPTLGLDAFWIREFLNIVSELSTELDSTVLFTTHNFDAVGAIADRIGFLHQGKIQYEINTKDIARKFTRVSLVLPDDNDPEALPDNFTLVEKKKRNIQGVFKVDHQIPEEAFGYLNPASFNTEPATLQDVYFHILKRKPDELIQT